MNVSTLKPPATVLIAAVALVIGLEAPAAAHEVAHKINGSDLVPNSVTGKQVKESTLGVVPTAKKALTLPPLKWHALKLVNGWKALTGGVAYFAPAYAVDAQGLVHLRGALTGGSSNVACTFPRSLRLASIDMFLPDVVGGIAAPADLRIIDNELSLLDAPGDSGSAAIFTDLDGVTFPEG